MAVTARSPLTGAMGVALPGGTSLPSCALRASMPVIIEGKADAPVYVAVQDGDVSVRSARSLWGTHTRIAQQMIKDELHDQNVRVACIGPAGEKLSRIACIVNERRAAGRKGLGAVMGRRISRPSPCGVPPRWLWPSGGSSRRRAAPCSGR